MTGAQAHAAALGVAHTPAVEAADCTPYLHVLSATKRSGKTRLLETLEFLVLVRDLNAVDCAVDGFRKGSAA
jgi:hypothetical protein